MKTPDIKELNSNTLRPVYISKRYPEFYSFLNDNYKDCKSLSEKLYLYYNRLSERPECVVCGSGAKFEGFFKGFRETCCAECSKKNPNINIKRKQTCLKKYGVENPMKNDTIKEKLKQTNLKKYGVENVSQSESIKEKIRQTNLEKYGVGCGMQSEVIKEKSRQTCLEKYGVEYASQSEIIKRKKERTFLEHYGVNNPVQKDSIKKKIILTNSIKYGYFCNLSSPLIKEKIKQTNLERYGVDNPMKNDSIKEKSITSLRKTSINNHPDLKRYDENNNWICKCPHPNCNKCSEKEYVISNQRYYDRKRLGSELCTKLLPIRSSTSTPELQIAEFLRSLNIDFEISNRTIITPKELDIYIPSKKIAIEFNGSYWHSVDQKDKYYHHNKTLECYSKGIQLIHIYESDWNADSESIKNKLKSLLEGNKVDGWISVEDSVNYTLSEPILIDCGGFKVWNEGKWEI